MENAVLSEAKYSSSSFFARALVFVCLGMMPAGFSNDIPMSEEDSNKR
jgi:hypothetical protein